MKNEKKKNPYLSLAKRISFLQSDVSVSESLLKKRCPRLVINCVCLKQKSKLSQIELCSKENIGGKIKNRDKIEILN